MRATTSRPPSAPTTTSPPQTCTPGPPDGATDAACPGVPFCLEALKGPDGVKAADAPSHTIGFGKYITKVVDTNPATPFADHVEIKCWVEGVRDSSNALVTTTAAGTCHGGPSNTVACTSNANCDTVTPSRYYCESGDEYHCQVDSLTGSNKDNVPPCASC